MNDGDEGTIPRFNDKKYLILAILSFCFGCLNLFKAAFTSCGLLSYALSGAICFAFMVLSINIFYSGICSLLSLKHDCKSLYTISVIFTFVYAVFLAFAYRWESILCFSAVEISICCAFISQYVKLKVKKDETDIAEILDIFKVNRINVRRNGEEITVSFDEISAGDEATICPGDIIPFDAKVTEGTTTVDEYALTGTNIPVPKSVGDFVFAGCINRYGNICIKSIAKSNENIISRVIKMINADKKREVYSFSDIFSSVVIAVIIAIFAVGLTVSYFINNEAGKTVNALAVYIMVAFPAPLTAAELLVSLSGIHMAKKRNILIQNINAINSTGKISTFIFDKEGTVTNGEHTVTGIYNIGNLSEAVALSYAVGAESVSQYPLGDAIYEYAFSKGITGAGILSYHDFGTKGVLAYAGKNEILLGSRCLMDEYGIKTDNTKHLKTSELQNITYLAVNSSLCLVITTDDMIKPDAKKTIDELMSMKYETILFDSHSENGAVSLASELGVDGKITETLPDGKAAKIKSLQDIGKRVAMVGDGINDTVALTLADIGISTGTSQIASKASDIILLEENLSGIIYIVNLGKIYKKIVYENVIFSYICSLIIVPAFVAIFKNFSLSFILWMICFVNFALIAVAAFNIFRLKKREETL